MTMFPAAGVADVYAVLLSAGAWGGMRMPAAAGVVVGQANCCPDGARGIAHVFCALFSELPDGKLMAYGLVC